MVLSPQTENLVSKVEELYRLHRPGRSLPDEFKGVLEYSYQERMKARSHPNREVILLFDRVYDRVREYETARTYYKEEFCLTPERALEKVKNKNWSEEAQEIIAVYGNLVPVLGLIAGVGHAIVRTIYTTLVPYSYQMHEFSQTKPFHQTVSGKVNFAAVRWEVRNVSSYRNDPGFIATSR